MNILDLLPKQVYIKITSRCNMRCPHCCLCSHEHGEDMPFEIFKRALDIAIQQS